MQYLLQFHNQILRQFEPLKDFRVLHNSNQWRNWGSYVLAIQFAFGLLREKRNERNYGEIVVSNGFHLRLWNVDMI